MAARSDIETCDSTFNPWMGCTRISPACDHCYAERHTARFGRVSWGHAPRVRTAASTWAQPYIWNRRPFYECLACGWRGAKRVRSGCPVCGPSRPGRATPRSRLVTARRRVFCASLADWLDTSVPIEWFTELLELIHATPNLDWLLLSKRVGNWESRLEAAADHVWKTVGNGDLMQWIDAWRFRGSAPTNVWIGATVVTPREADRDIPKLLQVPASVHYLSVEPMLDQISIARWLTVSGGIDWVICGGESGPGARPVHPAWVRSLRDECIAAGVAFFMKQWGAWIPYDFNNPPARRFELLLSLDGATDIPDFRAPDEAHGEVAVARVGTARAGRVLDGTTWSQFPRPAQHPSYARSGRLVASR